MPLEIKDIQNLEARLKEFETLKDEVKHLKKLVWQEPKEFISRADANKIKNYPI